ncbi:MAG: FHA domain-containing protein [Gemmataceae bacterium]|nr:FHA domain-containing protein [Gemmataceae bacterium]
MKVSLIVAQGVHKGKVIPIPIAQFVIGREEGCQLRPSSPAISKRHCALNVRGGKVFVQDFDSTNGTFVNDAKVNGEIEVKDGDTIRVGPLEFVLKVEKPASASRVQPKPSAEIPTPAPKEETPTKEQKLPAAAAASSEPDPEQLAAMLLSTDDGPTAGSSITPEQIPSGSTVFDMSALNMPEAEKKPEAKKPPQPEVDNSKRAAEILRKYMQRPRT